MGQYYMPIILDEEGRIEHHLVSHDYGYGTKLMEHSWLRSDFVQAVETLLVHEAPRRVVWAGDYADPELDEHGEPLKGSWTRDNGEVVVHDVNLYDLATDETLYRPAVPELGIKMRFMGRRDKNGDSIWKRGKDPEIVASATPQIIPTQTSHPFLLNWDKKEYVNKRRVPRARYRWDPDRPRAIHPLPLLTVEGNGRGGGDFREDGAQGNFDLIGSWARNQRPEADGWIEIHFDLVEPGAPHTKFLVA